MVIEKIQMKNNVIYARLAYIFLNFFISNL